MSLLEFQNITTTNENGKEKKIFIYNFGTQIDRHDLTA